MWYLAIFLLNSISISGKVERSVQQGREKELFSGDIIFEIPTLFYLHLYKPINQIFFIKRDSLYIYYPVEKRGFKGKIKNPMNNPLFKMVVGARNRIDLTPYNYRFLRRIVKGDTMYSEWVEKKNGIPIIKIGQIGGKQILFEVYDKNRKLVAKTEYKNHINLGNIYLPTNIYSFIILPKDTLKENMEYKDIKIDSIIPDSIKNFYFPKDINVELLKL